jgi:cyclic pyranopterin phosphate synthase
MKKSPQNSGQMPELEINERLHILAGPHCNNNCIFCIEEDRIARLQNIGAICFSDVINLIELNRHRKNVIFTSGEPTLNQHLPEYIRKARDLGYITIGICSNGRRFCYRQYAEILLSCGLNHIIIAIHGGEEKTHDSLTRTKGSFIQTMEGMRNLSSLRKKYRFRILTSSVINRKNCMKMEEIFYAVSPFADEMIFNVIQPWGRGWTFFRQLVPSYSEIASNFAIFLKKISKPYPVFLQDIPYCTTGFIPDFNRGYVERHVHYDKRKKGKSPWYETGEKDSDGTLKGLSIKKIEAADAGSEINPADLTGHTRDEQDMHTKV